MGRGGRSTVDEHPNAALARSGYEAMQNGDVATFAALLDDDVLWHESTPGYEGDYRGRDAVLAMLGRVLGESGVQITRLDLHGILADDDHTVVLLEVTSTRGARTATLQYADVYHVRDGKVVEHWHLAVDPKANEAFFANEPG
jgi:ketosteroid isomerase-like protein